MSVYEKSIPWFSRSVAQVESTFMQVIEQVWRHEHLMLSSTFQYDLKRIKYYRSRLLEESPINCMRHSKRTVLPVTAEWSHFEAGTYVLIAVDIVYIRTSRFKRGLKNLVNQDEQHRRPSHAS